MKAIKIIALVFFTLSFTYACFNLDDCLCDGETYLITTTNPSVSTTTDLNATTTTNPFMPTTTNPFASTTTEPNATTTTNPSVPTTTNPFVSTTTEPNATTTTNPSVPVPAPNLTLGNVTAYSVNLSWNSVNNASGYEIYQSSNESGMYEKITDNIKITGTSATITGLIESTIYYFKIKAIGNGGAYLNSPLSNYIKATTIGNSKIAAGGTYSLRIDETGQLWAWGDNRSGQLGDNTTTEKYTSQKIQEGTLFKAVAAGYYHSLAIDNSGQLWAWGDNSFGQLGNGTNNDETTPQKIQEGTVFKAVAAGWLHNLAIDNSGQLWAWGDNNSGRLGDGTTGGSKNTPTKIAVRGYGV